MLLQRSSIGPHFEFVTSGDDRVPFAPDVSLWVRYRDAMAFVGLCRTLQPHVDLVFVDCGPLKSNVSYDRRDWSLEIGSNALQGTRRIDIPGDGCLCDQEC